MNRKRQTQIEALAVQLLHKTGRFGELPVKADKVAEAIGLSVIPYDFPDDISGVLISQADNHSIGVNRNNNHKRQLFTIAHEIGHYVLGHQREGLFVDSAEKYFTIFNFRDQKSSTGEYIQEREANAFAASLLMPTELIYQVLRELSVKIDVINNTGDDEDIIKQMADRFGVSIQAMGFRMSNLGTLW